MPQLPDEIKRAGNENNVLGRSPCQRVLECLFGINDHYGAQRMVAGDFSELRGGDGARGSRLRENDFSGERK
jgi:hypothetical protein